MRRASVTRQDRSPIPAAGLQRYRDRMAACYGVPLEQPASLHPLRILVIDRTYESGAWLCRKSALCLWVSVCCAWQPTRLGLLVLVVWCGVVWYGVRVRVWRGGAGCVGG